MKTTSIDPIEKRTLDDKSIGTANRIDYILQLFIINSTPRSVQAITNIAKLCDEYLGGRFELEVVDISLNPSRAIDDQILAAPTLIRKLPLPYRRFIGDMSQTARILAGLGLQEAGKPSSEKSPDPQCN